MIQLIRHTNDISTTVRCRIGTAPFRSHEDFENYFTHFSLSLVAGAVYMCWSLGIRCAALGRELRLNRWIAPKTLVVCVFPVARRRVTTVVPYAAGGPRIIRLFAHRSQCRSRLRRTSGSPSMRVRLPKQRCAPTRWWERATFPCCS